ncbi:MAG: RidA family protein [Sphingomonadales bacterium]
MGLKMFFAVALAMTCCVGPALADGHSSVKRNKIPGSSFPIAESVEVPAGASLVFVSGAVPGPIVENGDPNAIETYGDTEAQTVSVLTRIEERLDRIGLGLADVVMMRAYMVADPKLGRMDFAGFMKGYTQFFGTAEQPNLPSRSALEVAGLARPAWLIEIGGVAARPATD